MDEDDHKENDDDEDDEEINQDEKANDDENDNDNDFWRDHLHKICCFTCISHGESLNSKTK